MRHPLKAVDFDQGSNVSRYKLAFIKGMPELQQAMVSLIGDRAGMLRPSMQKRFVTFGSCFALNLAASLRTRGAEVYTTRLTEDVNSPFNNRLLLHRIFGGRRSRFIEELEAASDGVDFDGMADVFRAATDIVITLGNIFHLDGPNGHTAVPKGAVLVRETFAETASYLEEIVLMLKKHTAARIFISVSPIPISGYMGDEFQSVVEADCASKCQLVAAARSLTGFEYVPTFEIFRWLSAHQAFSTFSERHSRHLIEEHIDTAMDILCG